MTINSYCDTSDIKAAMPDGSWGSSYDTELARLATQASRAIDIFAKKKPGAFYVSADVTRYFDGNDKSRLWIGELAAVPTSVAVAETGQVDSAAGTGGSYTTWAATDYLPWPYNALDEGQPFSRLDINILIGTKVIWYGFPKAVKIVGKFGFSATVPEGIKQCAIVQAARAFKRGQQAYKDAGAVAELGQLMYVRKLDPDLETLLGEYGFMGASL